MKNINFKGLITIAFLFGLTACVSTPSEQKEEIQLIEQEWRNLHSNLDELDQIGVDFKIRVFSYTPIFLFVREFGDITLSQQSAVPRQQKYVDLLDVRLVNLHITKCQKIKSVKISSEETIINPKLCGNVIAGKKSGYIFTGQAYSNSENDFQEIYARLKKLNAIVADIPTNEKEAFGNVIISIVGHRFTREQFITALDKVIAIPKIELLTKTHEMFIENTLMKKQIEAENIAAEKANEEKQKRELARMKKEKRIDIEREKAEAEILAIARIKNAKKLFNQNMIGSKICKNGELKFQAHRTLEIDYVNGRATGPVKWYKSEGQLMAYLEGFSKKGKRLQIRMAGYAFKESFVEALNQPMMGSLTSQPGVLAWDKNKDWFLCD